MQNKICGMCKWHSQELIDGGWVCVNDQSEDCTEWTDYDHGCEEWEGKDDEL